MTQLLVIAGFALSCFGILLFLWITWAGRSSTQAQRDPPSCSPKRPASWPSSQTCGSPASTSAKSRTSNGHAGQAGDRDDRHRRPVRADPQGHQGDPAHEDTARRDLRRTEHGQPHTGRSSKMAPNLPPANVAKIGPDRRDLPHLQPAHPRRLPGMDAGRRDRDQRAGPGPLLRDRPTRNDLQRIRKSLPRPRHPGAGGPKLFSNGTTALERFRGREGNSPS